MNYDRGAAAAYRPRGGWRTRATPNGSTLIEAFPEKITNLSPTEVEKKRNRETLLPVALISLALYLPL